MSEARKRTAKVRASATTSNLGPALDALALALGLWNSFEVEEADAGFEAAANGPGAERLPKNEENRVIHAFLETCRVFDLPRPAGLRVRIELAVPMEAGLGSSVTATVAGVVAADALAGRPLEAKDLASLASEIDGQAASVVACLQGGFAVSARGDDGKLEFLRFTPARAPSVVVATPRHFEVAAEKMRAALPPQIAHRDAVASVQRACLLVAALLEGERGPLARAMEDRIHEPYRAAHVPGFGAVCAAARGAGALGAALSGAGPSVVALADDDHDAAQIGEAMIAAWHAHRVEADARVLPIDLEGARCVLDPPEPEKKRARTTRLKRE